LGTKSITCKPPTRLTLKEKEVGMRKIFRLLIIAFVLLVAFGLAVTQTWAEEVKFTVTSYITKVEAIPVPDVEGHILVLAERRGVAVFEDGSAAAYHTRATCDLTKFQGPCQGYTDLTYPDGSKTIVKYQCTFEIPAGKKLPTLKGEGEFIKGIGRFEGIKGTLSFNAYQITPYAKETKGDLVVKATATYTLPSK
jgi:hypothetical protein